MCTLHVSILPTEGKLHTGKLRMVNYDWQTRYWQNTNGKTFAGKILHGQNTCVQYMTNSTRKRTLPASCVAHEVVCPSCIVSMYFAGQCFALCS